MLAPPIGAGAARVTVPVEGFPPCTEAGFKETPAKVTGCGPAGFTVIVATWLFPADAVTVAFCVVAGLVVVTANVPVSCPAGITIVPGTVTVGLLLDKVTVAPPAGAAATSVTVPVEVTPPFTVAGRIATCEIKGEGSASTTLTPPQGGEVNAVTVEPISEAEIRHRKINRRRRLPLSNRNGSQVCASIHETDGCATLRRRAGQRDCSGKRAVSISEIGDVHC